MQQLQTGSTLQSGKYRILSVLGQGGFGITYLAENIMLDGKVAIKEFFFKEYCNRDEETSHVTIPTDGNRKIVERFKMKFIKEARTIFKLNHPNIVRILDIFEENGTAYYVMDYIEGESLGDMVKRRGAIPEAEAIGYIKEAGSALTYIHGKSMNHLDIKPGNLMKRKGNSKVQVIDFGVAKQYDAATSEGTTTTPVGISHGYSPIEQYQKNGVQSFSPQSDVYALAATLFKLLTGNTPPEAMIVQDEGLPADELRAKGVSESVIRAIDAAMQTRKKRTQSVAEFLKNLDAKDDEDTVLTDETQKAEEERKRKEAEAKADKEKAEAETRAKAEAERKSKEEAERKAREEEAGRKRQQEEAAKAKRNKTVLWVVAAVIVIAFASVGINTFLGQSSTSTPEKKQSTSTSSSQRSSSSSSSNSSTSNNSNLQSILNELANNMVYVQGGTFTMGATSEQGSDTQSDEKPTHQVTLSSYYIGRTEVTQELWEAVMGSNPSKFTGNRKPVENVSWNDCKTFISKLNSITGKNYRFPTEAEWEFACRGGNRSNGYKYSGSNILGNVAWYYDNSGSTTHEVGTKSPNELGLYDMSGNVWEWCSDWYGNYSSSSQTNPTGASSGSHRVLRGGGWLNGAWYFRSSNRENYYPGDRFNGLGLRLCLSE